MNIIQFLIERSVGQTSKECVPLGHRDIVEVTGRQFENREIHERGIECLQNQSAFRCKQHRGMHHGNEEDMTPDHGKGRAIYRWRLATLPTGYKIAIGYGFAGFHGVGDEGLDLAPDFWVGDVGGMDGDAEEGVGAQGCEEELVPCEAYEAAPGGADAPA